MRDYNSLHVATDGHGPRKNPKEDLHNKCGRFWLVKDCCGMFCAFLTWGLIFYANFVVLCVILLPYPSPYSFINTVLFLGVTSLAVASHLRTMLSDPGAVPRGNATKECKLLVCSDKMCEICTTSPSILQTFNPNSKRGW